MGRGGGGGGGDTVTLPFLGGTVLVTAARLSFLPPRRRRRHTRLELLPRWRRESDGQGGCRTRPTTGAADWGRGEDEE